MTVIECGIDPEQAIAEWQIGGCTDNNQIVKASQESPRPVEATLTGNVPGK